MATNSINIAYVKRGDVGTPSEAWRQDSLRHRSAKCGQARGMPVGSDAWRGPADHSTRDELATVGAASPARKLVDGDQAIQFHANVHALSPGRCTSCGAQHSLRRSPCTTPRCWLSCSSGVRALHKGVRALVSKWAIRRPMTLRQHLTAQLRGWVLKLQSESQCLARSRAASRATGVK